MELLARFLILFSLLTVFIQDILSRAVYWLLFPLLTLLFIILRRLRSQLFAEIWQPFFFDICFLFIQMVILTGWFSYKNKMWVNVTAELIGWGDIFLLISFAFYLSLLNYLFFYMSSLLIILPLWVCWQYIFGKNSKQVPLAGLQALAMSFFLISDWWLYHQDITNDYWLIQLMGR